MLEQKYNWRRFWGVRDGIVRLTNHGMLEDPEGPYGHILNPDAKTLETLEGTPCLILLGEPGSGKSHEIDREVGELKTRQSEADVLHFQLRDFQTDLKLCQDIFDHNEGLQDWLTRQDRLHLFLDSLDEGLLNVSSLATLLIRELKKYPTEHLYIRLACRTAEWPEILERGLVEHWGIQNFRAYELLPLREKDIAEAASSEGIDALRFLEEVKRKGVGPLAAKPVTLKFLLKLYQKHEVLPRTQAELYAEGCRHLCEESSQSRAASRHRGSLNVEKRLLVAQRIAAITIFGNKASVWTGSITDRPESDVAVDELASGTEGTGSDRFSVEAEEIRETLNTGLFSSRGLNRVGWAHQTYAEFLAAQYLVENHVSLDQTIALVTHPSDERLIPQLYETAAWLGSMNPDAFRAIVKNDPAVLLRSDVASADTKDKITLVAALLEAADNEDWIDSDWSGSQLYYKLKHDALDQQLAPYISDRAKGFFARRIAADIAERCEVRNVQDDLVQVALDLEDDVNLRVNAAYALARIGDFATKQRLRPLALGQTGDDPDDELKGAGLLAVWPDHLSSEELFQSLTHPKRPSLTGLYKLSINQISSQLDRADLAVALKWLIDNGNHFDSLSPFRSIRNEIFCLALQNLDAPAVREALANIISDNVRILRGDEENLIVTDDEKRYTLLRSVIPKLADAETRTKWYGLIWGENRLIGPADIPWLLEFLASEQSSATQRLLAEIVNRLLDPRDTEHMALVIDAARTSPALAEVCRWFLSPVYLDSTQAHAQKRNYAEAQELNRGIPKPPPLDPPPIDRVRLLLNRFETGNTAAWWQLNREMTLEEDSRFYGDESESDLTKLSVWRIATSEDRQRLLETAKRYLADGDPQPAKWLGKNLMWRPAYAGYRALRLLHDHNAEYLAALSDETWKKWSSIVVAYPFQNQPSDAEVQARLVKLAYQNAHDEVIQIVLSLISKDNRTDGYLSALKTLQHCWDDRLISALTNKLKTGKLKPSSLRQLLSELLARDGLEAKLYAKRLISRRSASPTAAAKAESAARGLVLDGDDAGWDVIWPRIQSDREFGRRLIESISGSPYTRDNTIAARLNEDREY